MMYLDIYSSYTGPNVVTLNGIGPALNVKTACNTGVKLGSPTDTQINMDDNEFHISYDGDTTQERRWECTNRDADDR